MLIELDQRCKMRVNASGINSWQTKRRLVTGGRSTAARAICQYTGLANPIMAVLKLSRDLVARSGQDHPPYDPDKYAREQNAEIKPEHYNMGYEGRIFPAGDGYVIEVYSGQPEAKLRFCCCHEIGHTFFLSLYGTNSRKSAVKVDYKIDLLTEVSEEERLCNIAASELLMPSDVFREKASKDGPGIEHISELAETFNVSFIASVIKILETGIWKCVAIIWVPKESPENGFHVHWMGKSLGWNFTITQEKIGELERKQRLADINSGVYASYLTGKPYTEGMENGYIMESTRKSLDSQTKYVFSLVYKSQWI